MNKFNEYKQQLHNLISTGKRNIVVCGNSGLGKSELIKQVCRETKNSIWISYDFALYENSFKEILISKFRQSFYVKKIAFPILNNKISLEEQVFQWINRLDKKYQVFFSFENIESATQSDVLFICKLIEFSRIISVLCVIIEKDTDELNNNNYNILMQHDVFNSLKLSRYGECDIKRYICKILNCKEMQIEEQDWKHLCETAQGTLSIVNIILNELMQRNLTTNECGVFKVSSLPNNFLIAGVKSCITKRFDGLNNDYKILLAKSSCIGMAFEEKDIFNIFSIAKLSDILQNIEDTSHLIFRIEETSYRFESREVHQLIKDSVQKYCDKSSVIKACAEYYNLTLNQHLKDQNYAKYVRNLTLAKELYESINDIPNVLACFQLLIGYKIESKSYLEAKKLCIEFASYCSDDNLSRINNIKYLECLIELEEFEIVQPIIKELKDSYSYLCMPYLDYYSALGYYGVSDAKKALNLLLENIDYIDTCNEALLYAKELRLLSSIYDFYNDWEKQLEYFNKAIEICQKECLECEYYSILRQSGMVYAPEIALKHYDACEKYFTEHNDIKELAKLTHNIATDSIYLLNWDISQKKCNESIYHFTSIGSHHLASPLNLKGILLCLNEQQYSSAINLFIQSASLSNDKFMKCTAYINAATAYRKLGDQKNYRNYLELSKQLNQGTMPIITINEKLCEALNFFELRCYCNCKKIITELAEMENFLEFRHEYVVKYMFDVIFPNKNYSYSNCVPKLQTNYINNLCVEYLQKCMNDLCYWATTRFWEN